MSDTANVRSLDSLRIFRAALIKFAESTNVALTSSESDIQRTLGWLEREQTLHWDSQLRKRHEDVTRAEDALRQKRLFKAPDGSEQSFVDEMKALNNARRRREEAEQKTVLVKKAINVLRRESLLYKGRMQKLATTAQIEIPRAVHLLDQMLKYLEEYLAVQTAGAGMAPAAEAIENMMRMALPTPPPAEQPTDASADPNQPAAPPNDTTPVTSAPPPQSTT